MPGGVRGADAQAIRDQLERRLDRLLARGGRITSDLRKPGERDSQEQAVQRENDEVLERLDAAERADVVALRAALARLDAGRYGECERCGGQIASERLAALPETATCVTCAQSTGAS